MTKGTYQPFLLAALLALPFSVVSAAELGPTMQKIKDSGNITIGYRASAVPYSYLDDDQKPIGFSMDLCSLVLDKLESTLDTDINVTYQLVNPSNRIPLVKNGTADIVCGSTANMESRQKVVAFSVSFYIPEVRILTRASADVGSIDDLSGKSIVVTQGSNALQVAQKLDAEHDLGLTILKAKDHAQSFVLVKTSRAAAFIEDDIVLAALKATSSAPADYKLLDWSAPNSPQGVMLRKGNPDLKELIDGVLTKAMESGTYDELYTKWFQSPIPPKGVNLDFPQSENLKALVAKPNDKSLSQMSTQQ